MEIIIEKICIDGEVVIGFIHCENAVKYIADELKKYEEGKGEIPYFNFFNERYLKHKEEYRFSWLCDYDQPSEIKYNEGAYISENENNYIEWHIL